jgi:putative FmdB family regulatory protein
MPTYEYLCPEGHQFEVFQRISEEPGADCPQCGQPAKRQISAGAGFLFKGEGFYVTDYRSADYKKKASSEGGGDAKEAPKSDTPKTPSPSTTDD